MMNVPPLPPKRPTSPKKLPVCSLNNALSIIKQNCGNVHVLERHGSGPNKVIILPEATRELEMMVSYGRCSPMNAKEQKYVGYGHYLKDENSHNITIVKHFIEIQTMNRSATSASNLGPNGEYNPGLDFLEYYREEFLRTEAKFNTDALGFQVDPFISLCGPSEYVLEGHTHPNLGVFFSAIDKVSGSARAACSPVCTFVCDPIRQKMLGGIGHELNRAEIIVLSNRNTLYGGPNENSQLPRPMNLILQIVRQCLRSCSYTGRYKITTKLDGRKSLKITMTETHNPRIATVTKHKRR